LLRKTDRPIKKDRKTSDGVNVLCNIAAISLQIISPVFFPLFLSLITLLCASLLVGFLLVAGDENLGSL
jgi:hypothetical protein